MLYFVVLLCSSFSNHENILYKNILKKVKKEISKVFVLEDFELSPVQIQPNEELIADFSGNRLLEISSNDTKLGYAYIGTAPSKTETFEYLVLFDNQFIIKKAKVLIVGVGGLGCSVAEFLVRAGVGNIGIVDNDIVNISNIHRQSLYDTNDVKNSKVNLQKKN